MKYKVYTVYDSKVESYSNSLWLFKNKGEAIRSFTDAVNDAKTVFHQHPEDYVFFEIGDYNIDNAELVRYDAPKSVGVALEFLKTN